MLWLNLLLNVLTVAVIFTAAVGIIAIVAIGLNSF